MLGVLSKKYFLKVKTLAKWGEASAFRLVEREPLRWFNTLSRTTTMQKIWP